MPDVDALSALTREVEALPTPLREALAEAWARAALDEHASIASFSRFSLHLQAVAAPPELIAEAHHAALDELEHARLCFTLASVYAGRPLGPGALDLRGDLLGPLALAPIVAAAVVEGCVGETVAALEAARAAEASVHPAVREALTRIAEDESRHAALAWRFVRWGLDQGQPEVTEAARRAFASALDAPPPPAPPVEPDEALMAAHGRPGARQRHEVRREAAEALLRPMVTALLG